MKKYRVIYRDVTVTTVEGEHCVTEVVCATVLEFGDIWSWSEVRSQIAKGFWLKDVEPKTAIMPGAILKIEVIE